MKTMTCYGCKGKGHTSGEVCDICGGSGKIPVPPEPFPPDPEIEEKPEKE
jgi:rRNA maturation protein Nop10